jgi:hypothetical protein
MSTGAQGTATLTFAADSNPGKPVVGSNFATVTVTGQIALAATDAIDVWIQGTDSTASHNAYEHQIADIRLAVTNVVAGVGFDITAYSDMRLDGDFQVRWAWVGGVGEKVGTTIVNFPASAQAAEYSSEVLATDSNPNPNQLRDITLPGTATWDRIAYGNGTFVAIAGSYNKCAVSSDGINWVERTLANGAVPRADICYGEGRFLIIGGNSGGTGYSEYSDNNGQTWTSGGDPGPAYIWRKVAIGGGRAMCIGSGAGGTADFATSTDKGATWTYRATFPDTSDKQSVAYGNGTFIVVSLANKAYLSLDGVSWSQSAAVLPNGADAVAFTGNTFVAIGAPNAVSAYSTDGINWTYGTLPTASYWVDLASVAGKFVTVTDVGISISSDLGKTFQTLTYPTYDITINRISRGDGAVIVFRGNGSKSAYMLGGNARTLSTVNTQTAALKPVPGSNTASTTVTGLTTFNATDAVEVWVQGNDITADHNEVEHALAPIQLRATNPIAGVGFTIVATSPHRLDGGFKVRYAFTP